MGSGYKRDEWNFGVIDVVNGVLESPPEDTDCEPVDTLSHVPPRHRWAKGDILAVQNAISQTCPDISWDPVPETWKQSIIDEIMAKLGQAWCDCEDEDKCDPAELHPCPFGTPYADIIFQAPQDFPTGDPDWFYFDYANYLRGIGVAGPPGFRTMNYVLTRLQIDDHESTNGVTLGVIGLGNTSEDPAVVALCDGILRTTAGDTSGENGQLFKQDFHEFRLRLSCGSVGPDLTSQINFLNDRIEQLHEDIQTWNQATAAFEAGVAAAQETLDQALAAATTPEEIAAAEAAYFAAIDAVFTAYFAATNDLIGDLGDMEEELEEREEELEDARAAQMFAGARVLRRCCLLEDEEPPPPPEVP